MLGFRPIPARLLPDDMGVRVPDGAGGFEAAVAIRGVRFEEAQSVADDAHRSADGGAGKVFVDAVNSAGAFEVPAGSRVELRGRSYYVAKCGRFETVGGTVHHWELTIR